MNLPVVALHKSDEPKETAGGSITGSPTDQFNPSTTALQPSSDYDDAHLCKTMTGRSVMALILISST